MNQLPAHAHALTMKQASGAGGPAGPARPTILHRQQLRQEKQPHRPFFKTDDGKQGISRVADLLENNSTHRQAGRLAS